MSRRHILLLLATAIAVVAAAAAAYALRGRFLCRNADVPTCHACCQEAGFRISGSSPTDPCECFDAIDLVDDRGTIHLE